MEILDKIGRATTGLGQDLSNRAKRFSGIAKLQYDLRSRENDVKKLYLSLGERYYEEHREDDDEDIAELTVLLGEIEEIKDEIAALGDGEVCPECGARVPKGSNFCNTCGAKISIFEEEDETDE